MSTGVGKRIFRLNQWVWNMVDWIYPPRCGGCGQLTSRWCTDCQAKIKHIDGNICLYCGQPQCSSRICHKCLVSPPAYQALRSWAIYDGPLRNALLRLKYKGDITMGEALSKPLITMLIELNWKIDLITPVPTGVSRMAQRGYNQAALLALPLAMSCGIKYSPRAMSKVKDTRSQVGLNPIERLENVIDAFQAQSNLVEGKCILVIDDITTSGATMESCAKALLRAGAKKVYGLTLAYSGYFSRMNN
jgi:competence protein ComFC